VNAVQLVALLVVENSPLGQAAHARFVVASPSEMTNWPAAQVVRDTHAVAALPS